MFTFKEGAFYRTLKQRTAQYFKDRKIGTKAPLLHQILGVGTILGMTVCAYYGFYQGSFVCAPKLSPSCSGMLKNGQ
jgi:hypothetical protein